MEQLVNQQTQNAFFVNKDRQKEYDEKVCSQLRQARSHFYTHQIVNRLNEAKVQQNIKCFIIEQYSGYKDTADSNMRKLQPYENVIRQLNQIIQSIQEQFAKKKRECLPLKQIIQKKITSLKSIHIQYKLYINSLNQQGCRYSISAYDLFKVVHDNKHLTSLILRGVQVLKFQQFIKVTNSKNRLQDNDEIAWINNFNPSKQLRIAIQTVLLFKIDRTQQTICLLHDFHYFINLFYQVSDIKVMIKVQKWNEISECKSILWNLWNHLRQVKKIKITILGQVKDEYDEQLSKIDMKQIQQVRSVLFGGLASLNSISQLSLRDVSFERNIARRFSLAFEQILRSIFENNHITHLQIYNCLNLPSLPEINSLQFISLYYLSVCRNASSISFMDQILKCNKSLRTVICCRSSQEWVIDETLFNQLETLIIQRCNKATFLGVFSQSPSKIRHLDIKSCQIGSTQCLSQIFPKLYNIQRLQLDKNNFEHKLIDIIPTSSLRELHLSYSDIISDQWLKRVDQKWPKLKKLGLQRCISLTDAWSLCNFKGLQDFRVDIRANMLGEKKKVLRQLKCRGVRVTYYL